MEEFNPLPRAHALSAQASLLVRPSHPPLLALQDAREAYAKAADLFAQASDTAADEGAKRTLTLLVSQNRKLAKDVERRISARDNGLSPTSSPGGSRRASASGASGNAEAGPSTPTPLRGVLPSSSTAPKSRIGAADALGFGATGMVPSPATGLSSPSSAARSIPPFALRPGTAPRALSLGSAFATATTTTPERPDGSILQPLGSGPFVGSSTATSPLYSSSSSSEHPDESYVNFGAIPDTIDPFSRFWARLDNMLDDISNPVKFANATVAPLPVLDEEEVRKVRARRKDKSRERERRADKGDKSKGDKADDVKLGSPSGSYYLVQKSSLPRPVSPKESRNASPSTKTPEELALENEHLRASLDALAVHAQALDEANKALRSQADEREKVMKSVVVGVRREARKAKQGHDIMRSQLLQQSSLSPRIPADLASPPLPGEDPAVVTGLRRRVHDLEEEVAALKADNEKQKSHVAKYKERFEKIKVNARAKKAAREGSAEPNAEGQ